MGPYEADLDASKLRCFDEKRRFGIDLLYPWSRYVEGLKLPTVLGRECESDEDCPAHHSSQHAGSCLEVGTTRRCEYLNPLNAPNPTYPHLMPRVDASRVFLLGLVGVPWQDVASETSLSDPERLELLDSATLADRWDIVLGDPDEDMPPTDPFMVESVEPRLERDPNPITGDAPQPTNSPPAASPINGHEYTIPLRDDLQYACTFPLPEARDCTSYSGGCDCDGSSPDRPLCQAPGEDVVSTTQYYDRAYPGLRYLQVLREYGSNSIVASVCPKALDSTGTLSGYHVAMDALVDRMATQLAGRGCQRLPFQTTRDGEPACRYLEATEPEHGVTCDTLGRSAVGYALGDRARAMLETRGYCGSEDAQTSCSRMRLCMLEPASDPDRCLQTPDEELGDAPIAGYCQVDAATGNPELLADCPLGSVARLRFVSEGVEPPVPHPQAVVLSVCEYSWPG